MSGVRWLCVVALTATTGCAADAADAADADSAGAEESTQGLVVVERTESLGGAAPRAHVSARFMRVHGMDAESASRLVGIMPPLPAVGSCERAPAPVEPMEEASAAAIELVDVGDVLVQPAGAASVLLAARAFPDVGGVVSGVVYTSRDEAADVTPGVQYLIEASGSTRIEAFTSRADAPQAPEAVLVAGQALDGEDLVIAPGQSIALGWEPGARGDHIYVELAWDGGDPVRCTFDDDGRGEIPATFGRPDGAHGLTLGIHRLRRTAIGFDADGRPSELGEALAEFDFAATADVSVLDPSL